jgi:hypothetical protein
MAPMRRMMPWLVFVAAAAAAAAAPLAVRTLPAAAAADAFPGWPAALDGRLLTELPLTPREAAFSRDFPGRIARFTDGEREIVLRWIAAPTRRLHPAADCFRGLGYRIETRPMRLASGGAPMSCFRAYGRTDTYDVCEQMTSTSGRTWPDVSSWYWHALWSDRGATWWSLVIATPAPKPRREG